MKRWKRYYEGIEYDVDYPDSYPADEANRRCPDILKAKIQIKYNPKIDFNEGLKRFIHWSISLQVNNKVSNKVRLGLIVEMGQKLY